MQDSFRRNRQWRHNVSNYVKRYLDNVKMSIFRTRHSTSPRLIGSACVSNGWASLNDPLPKKATIGAEEMASFLGGHR
jgi:hypothetical protein